MRRRIPQAYIDLLGIIGIIWVFLGLTLLYNQGIITGHIASAPAYPGQVSQVHLNDAYQDLWFGLYGTITPGEATSNLTINFTNLSKQTYRRALTFPNFCIYGKLIATQDPAFDLSGLTTATHATHDAFLGLPPALLGSSDLFTAQRRYNIGQYALDLYSAELNGDLGYFYQGFGYSDGTDVFYVVPSVNNGIGFNGMSTNYEFILPRLSNPSTWYFYYDTTDCESALNITEPEPEQNLTPELSVEIPERMCVGEGVTLLAVDLSNRIYCLNREDKLIQSQCRETPDTEIEIYFGDETDPTTTVTTDDNGVAAFTPARKGHYRFHVVTNEKSKDKIAFAGTCESFDTITIAAEYTYNATGNISEMTPMLEVPTVLGPIQRPFIPETIYTTLTIAWSLITIPLLFGLAIVYYLHYRDSSVILLKLRIFFAQIKAQAKMRMDKE